ncbi:MAG: hypothetical protein M1836_005773 [Candelina mexicana]|nr:MAG: hypothetical protein M1836_005773 [Candelina mexicana]
MQLSIYSLPLLLSFVGTLYTSITLTNPIIEGFRDLLEAVTPQSHFLNRRHFNVDCNETTKRDRITDELGFALEALRITQREVDANNYYYRNFIPGNRQKDWINDFKNNTLQNLINLAADQDFTLRITCNPAADRGCAIPTHGKETFAYTDPQSRVTSLCPNWFGLPKTRDLQQKCDGRNLEQYQTGAFVLINQFLRLKYTDITPEKQLYIRLSIEASLSFSFRKQLTSTRWTDHAYGVGECFDLAHDPDPKKSEVLNRNPDTYALTALGTYFSTKTNCDIKLGYKGA